MTATYGNLDRGLAKSYLIDFLNANPPKVVLTLDPPIGGGADDHAHLQTALTLAQTTGAALAFPKGAHTYTLSAGLTISRPLYWTGEGRGSVLRVDPAATRFTPILVQSDDFSAIHGLVLRDFTVDGAGKGTLDNGLVQINNAVGFLVDDLYVVNGGTPGESSSQGVAGISVSAGAVGASGQPVGAIRNCEVTATTKAAVNSTGGVRGLVIEGNYLHDLTGNSETPGIQVNGGPNTRVIGNQIERVQGAGILVATVGTTPPDYPARCVIADNVVTNAGTGTVSGAGIAVVNGQGQSSATRGRIVISGNIVTSPGNGSNAVPGILVQNQDDVVLADNLVDDVPSNGIMIQNCRRVTVDGGAVTRCNSANQSVGSAVYLGTTGSSVTTAVRVAGVQCHNTTQEGSGHQKYPIYLDPQGGAGSLTNVQILDNPSSGSETLEFPAGTWGPLTTIRHTASVATPNGVTVNAAYATLEAAGVAEVRARAVAKSAGNANRAVYGRGALVTQTGGTATFQSGGGYDLLTPLASDVTWGVGGPSNRALEWVTVGAQPVLQLTGKTGAAITWAVTLDVQTV